MLDDRESNSNNSLMFLTIFFLLFLFFVIGIFVYDRFTNGTLGEQINSGKTNNIVEEDNKDNSNIIIEDKDLESIKIRLEDDFFLDSIISKNNIKDITNNDLLYYLIKLTESQSQFGKVDNVPINIVEDIHKESLFKDIKFNHDNINIDNKLLWVYNKDLNIYVKNNVTKDKNIIPIFIKLDNVKKENNSYILSYKYGLKSISDNKIYGSYNDLINKVNPLQVDNANNKEVLKQQLNNNYNNIKDKLSTYNYIVEVNDNNYILKDFNINK